MDVDDQLLCEQLLLLLLTENGRPVAGVTKTATRHLCVNRSDPRCRASAHRRPREADPPALRRLQWCIAGTTRLVRVLVHSSTRPRPVPAL